MKKQTRLILVKMHKNIGRLLEIYQNWVIDSYDLDVLANRNGKVTKRKKMQEDLVLTF